MKIVVGDTSITTGQVGTDSINATTTQVGNTSFTSGVAIDLSEVARSRN